MLQGRQEEATRVEALFLEELAAVGPSTCAEGGWYDQIEAMVHFIRKT